MQNNIYKMSKSRRKVYAPRCICKLKNFCQNIPPSPTLSSVVEIRPVPSRTGGCKCLKEKPDPSPFPAMDCPSITENHV